MGIFGRIKAMFNKPIFGVGPGDVAAAAVSEPRYLPQSQLTTQTIHGVGTDWKPWRIAADGTQWYERDDGSEQPTIHAEADMDDFDDDDDDRDRTEEIMNEFHRNCAILKSRYQRGEITGTDDAIDDEEFDDDDE